MFIDNIVQLASKDYCSLKVNELTGSVSQRKVSLETMSLNFKPSKTASSTESIRDTVRTY